ncbi:MAG TPA: zinc ribbon domain-containing protein, partial [Candidatus Dormibacteraeota bacterium]|nr:zinc ribbon domain-containing protein [Candidatus Dormibacteraeota bacterium]
IRRQWGGRRSASNWAVRTLKADLDAYRESGESKEPPSLTHGRIVGEGLDAAGRLRQKGIPGARARRRGPADAALAELRRQLRYQTPWYGSEVVEADRCFASSRTCHGCGLVQDLGGAEHWSGNGCWCAHWGRARKRG